MVDVAGCSTNHFTLRWEHRMMSRTTRLGQSKGEYSLAAPTCQGCGRQQAVAGVVGAAGAAGAEEDCKMTEIY